MDFHRLKMVKIKTISSSGQSLFIIVVAVVSVVKQCCQVEKACEANWVVLKTEGFSGMQDFSAKTGTALDKLGWLFTLICDCKQDL